MTTHLLFGPLIILLSGSPHRKWSLKHLYLNYYDSLASLHPFSWFSHQATWFYRGVFWPRDRPDVWSPYQNRSKRPLNWWWCLYINHLHAFRMFYVWKKKTKSQEFWNVSDRIINHKLQKEALFLRKVWFLWERFLEFPLSSKMHCAILDCCESNGSFLDNINDRIWILLAPQSRILGITR